MDSTLYDQFLPHRGLFHPGTAACGGSGPSSTSSSNSPRRPTATTNRPPVLDISPTANCGPKWRRLVSAAALDGTGCQVDDSDVTLGLALTSPDIEDFLFHTPPPSEISSDDASTALPLTPQPFATCDDDDNVLVGILGGGVSMATTPESDILFTGAVTAEQEAYARGFVDALEELRRKDEGLGKPMLYQQQNNQHLQTSGSANVCTDAVGLERTTLTGKTTDVRQSPLVALSAATGNTRWPASYVEVSPRHPLHHQTPTELTSPASLTPKLNGQFAFLVDAARTSGTDFTLQQPHRQAKFARLSGTSTVSTVDLFRSSNGDRLRKAPELGAQMSQTSVSGQQSTFVARMAAPICRTSLSQVIVGGPSYRCLQSLAGSSATASAASAADERAQTVPRLGTTPPLASLSTGSGVSRRPVFDADVLEEDDVDDDEFGDGNMTPRELARADRKRERNRLAARKCRSRKLEQIATLEARCAVLRAENDALIKSASGIADDVAQLRDRLQRHVSGPDCRLGANHKWPALSVPETRQSDVVGHSASSSSTSST